jgi:hypothetical protein
MTNALRIAAAPGERFAAMVTFEHSSAQAAGAAAYF